MALDWRQNFVSAQYLENKATEFHLYIKFIKLIEKEEASHLFSPSYCATKIVKESDYSPTTVLFML